MTAQPVLEPGHVVAGRYRIEAQIGAGGVGSVYRVRHVHTDEVLALKVLQTHALNDADAVERFRKEARVTARIASEHVTRVTDADTAKDLGDAPFLVMELLRGNDLTQVIAARGPLPPALVVELLQQAARALDKAHAIGIVHRDLKPDNLFLTQREDGTPCVKLLDFGIARITDAAPSSMKTQAGMVFGTPGYMAPEQMTGEADLISPATDVWALGLVAYCMLVGQDFWSAPTLAQLFATVLAGPIPRPSDRGSTLGEGFDVWFARAVARDPKERFQAAGEAVAALSSALGLRASSPPVGLPPLDRVRSVPPPAEVFVAGAATASVGPGDRRLFVALAVGAAVFVVVVGTILGLRAVTGPEPVPVALASPSQSAAPPPLPSAAPASAATAPHPVETADPVAPWAAVHESATARPADPVRPSRGGGRRDQRERLDVLQRLCDQGTVTAAECAAKRQAILRGDP